MTTTANMNLALPDEGGSAGTWGTILNTLLGLVDAHDHTTGKGVKVPSSGLNINADVAWATHAATGFLGAGFTASSAGSVAAYTNMVFVNSADNDLYFRNASGTNVKITDGNTLNVSIVGGIGGDYSSIGALLDYDDASDTYRFRQQVATAVRQFAKISAADVQLFEYLAAGATPVPANAVKLKSPAGLAAAYSVVFPAAVPASTSVVQMSNAGVLTASPTGAIASGAIVSSGEVTGTVIHHTTAMSMVIPATLSSDNAAATSGTTHTRSYSVWVVAASATKIYYPVQLPVGAVITEYRINLTKSDTTNAVLSKLVHVDSSSTDQNDSAGANSGVSAGAQILGESGLSVSVAAGTQYYIRITPGGTANPSADHVNDVTIKWTY